LQMANATEQRIPLDDLLVFHRLARSLTSSLDLQTILRTILDHMERQIQAELWTLLMLDDTRGELYYAIAAGGEESALRDLRVKVGEGVAGWVAQHGETLIIPETESDPRLKAEGSAHLRPGRIRRVRSVIALPLKGRTGTLGVIEILNPHAGQMDDYTIAFLHILADHAAIAIENANVHARIQQLTITDDTTGLYNVRHLYDALGRELDICLHSALPLSLAFLDLDRFKLVNDEHGHLIGSELLARVGDRLRELSRSRDLCFRYGGDEFAILLPEAGPEAALTHMTALNKALMNTRFRMSNGIELRVHASVGISTAPSDGTTMHEVIAVADARMYQVKASGRGSVRGA
jgi:diguanylate cyclase (GGDEF)-like protein